MNEKTHERRDVAHNSRSVDPRDAKIRDWQTTITYRNLPHPLGLVTFSPEATPRGFSGIYRRSTRGIIAPFDPWLELTIRPALNENVRLPFAHLL